MGSYEFNIKLEYVMSCLMWMRFYIPIIALFYMASQVSIEEFGIIFGVFSLSILLLEVPSGVIADLLGRKKTLLLARFFFVIEIIIVCFANGFLPFFIAKIISGIGVSLTSGTSQALLYESMEKLGREHEHKKISGQITMFSQISMAVVFIIGSILFSIDSKLPAYASLPFITLGFILTFFYKETADTVKATCKGSYAHLKEGIKHFFDNKRIIGVTVYSVPLGMLIGIIVTISSAFLEAVAIPVASIGTIAFIGSLLMAFGSKITDRIERIFGLAKVMVTSQILVVISIVTMSLLIPIVSGIAYLLIPFITGIFGVSINHYMNEAISPKHRATMLSIRNMFKDVAIFIFFPAFGFLVGNYNYQVALLSLLGVFVLGSTWYFIKYHAITIRTVE